MSIEVLALGERCNLDCPYCYEKASRCNQDTHVSYDREALLPMLRKLTPSDARRHPWTLFGGEPLLLPLSQLEELLALCFAQYGQTNVQTNATLVSPRHVELFIKYKTHVGISMDGPGELNDARWAGTLEATRKATGRSLNAIDALLAAGLRPSFIVQLHKLNVASDRWPTFVEWLRELDAKGIASMQYHLLDLDNDADDLHVDAASMAERLLELWKISDSFVNLRVQEFGEVVAAQRGRGVNTCVWHACDPWNTAAVEGLYGDGTPAQCGRAAANDGKNWLPAQGDGKPTVSAAGGYAGARHHERQLSLYVTPESAGGCGGCRFWLMCQGHCPGSGLRSAADANGDWRLRSAYCTVFKKLFEEAERRVEAVGEVPTSRRKDRLAIEADLYRSWTRKEEPTLVQVLRVGGKR